MIQYSFQAGFFLQHTVDPTINVVPYTPTPSNGYADQGFNFTKQLEFTLALDDFTVPTHAFYPYGIELPQTFTFDADDNLLIFIEYIPELSGNGPEHLDYTQGTLWSEVVGTFNPFITCLLYTSPSPRDRTRSRMPSSA